MRSGLVEEKTEEDGDERIGATGTCTGQHPTRDPLNRVRSIDSSPHAARVVRAGHGGPRKMEGIAGPGSRMEGGCYGSYRPFSPSR